MAVGRRGEEMSANVRTTVNRKRKRGKQGLVGERRGKRTSREQKRRGNGRVGNKKRGATRGLPRGSPILVLLSPKHA